MQIMTVLGSPRRQGNTAKVLAWVEEQLRAEGHDVERVDVVDCTVRGCGECMACKKGLVDLCAIEDDDANALFRRMVAADRVLLASPVFCWGFPAQIKAPIDRMFCMMDSDARRTGVPRLHDKPLALLLTAGGEEADNADLVIRGFENLVELLGGRLGGHLLIPDCTSPDALGDEAKRRAVQFAKSLAHAGPAPAKKHT